MLVLARKSREAVVVGGSRLASKLDRRLRRDADARWPPGTFFQTDL